jgi:endonuclease/exonuclease/phosphatase (EEP) superfamily protein YafD
VPSTDNFGIALYSKLPLDEVDVWHMGRAEVPAIAARVIRGAETIMVHAIHVLPPSSRANWIDRNQALNELAVKIQTQQQPLIVVGDLNTTSWSAAFGDFVAATDLDDTRVGFGVQPTFPSDRLVVRIPIDHCLVSSTISVIDRHVGPNIGSDHLPVVIDLAVTSQADDEAR